MFYSRFLDQIAANKIDKLDKHRFLVQSTELTVEDHERLSSIPVSSRNEEVIFDRLNFYELIGIS